MPERNKNPWVSEPLSGQLTPQEVSQVIETQARFRARRGHAPTHDPIAHTGHEVPLLGITTKSERRRLKAFERRTTQRIKQRDAILHRQDARRYGRGELVRGLATLTVLGVLALGTDVVANQVLGSPPRLDNPPTSINPRR